MPSAHHLFLLVCFASVVGCGEEEESAARTGPQPTPATVTLGEAAEPEARPLEEALERAEEAGADPRKFAVLVSIQNYPREQGLEVLHGPHNDCQLLRQALRRFGFQGDNVLHLADAEATVSGILTAIDEYFVRRPPAGSELLFYFAGHGSRCHDEERLEPGGYDSSLLAFDSRSENRKGTHDISDDVVQGILRHLCRELGHKVTWITDCCHSGDSTRGAGRGRYAGAVNASPELELWEHRPHWLTPVPDSTESTRLDGFVHLSACTSKQESHEGPVATAGGGRRVHGLFTWALCAALDDLQPGQTYGELARLVRYRTTELLRQARRREPQVPQAAGELRRRVFAAGFSVRRARHEARVAGGGLVIGGGAIHGLEPGSGLKLYEVGGAEIGTARLTEVEISSALAQWVERPEKLPRAPLEAEWFSAPENASSLVIQCPDAELRREIAAIDGLLAREPDAGFGKPDGEDPDALELVRTEERILLRTREGVPVRLLDSEDSDVRRRQLGDWQLRERLWRRLVDLTRGRGPSVPPDAIPAPILSIVELAGDEPVLADLRAEGRDFVALPRPQLEASSGLAQLRVPAGAGEKLALAKLRIEHTGFDAAHAVVLSMGESQRRIHVLYPDESYGEGRPLRDVVGKDIHTRDLVLVFEAADPVTWKASRPERWRYLVLLSETALPVEPFRRPEAAAGASRGAGFGAGLGLRLGLRAERTRGSGAWGFGALELDVGR